MYDVAIIGGGPGGSTCGTYLKKYNPDLKVVLLEREQFPRDHVGESLLPIVPRVLHDIGVWDKVEAADFPVKIGATYRWGNSKDLWDFEFLPNGIFHESPRPGVYEGQRQKTAFQVDRSIYDKILLDHSAENGVEVREQTRVVKVQRTGDTVDGLVLDNGEVITATYYVDASGQSGLVRRAMDVEVDSPTNLRNIAIWDYWQNADWASHVGVGGTRILVLSLGYGWIWFIPLGPTRTSIGLVCPAEYFKQTGLKADEIYAKALDDEPLIKSLLTKATCEGKLTTTNDWSFLAERVAGENWFLVGDACGFADPILSAGMTLAMMGAKHVSHMLLELFRGEISKEWLIDSYNSVHRKRIRQHILFADFWYSANAHFTELKEYTRSIARNAGLDLDADSAFQWLGTGGFANDDPTHPVLGTYSLAAVKQLNQLISGTTSHWQVAQHNVFKLNLEGATEEQIPILFEGRVWPKTAYRRGNSFLPRYGAFGIAINVLEKESLAQAVVERLLAFFREKPIYDSPSSGVHMILCTIEAMIAEGWVTCETNPAFGLLDIATATENEMIHFNRELLMASGN